MDPILTTPRLKLTLIKAAPRGSQEFEWIHEVRSNAQSSWWSLYGAAKTPEDTEKSLERMFAPAAVEGEDKIVRIPYAVHQLLDSRNEAGEKESRFIGLINLHTLAAEDLTHPPHDTHASTPTMLSLEIAYMYLPDAWGHGYATESVSAVLDAVKRSSAEMWEPYAKVKVRAIVHDENIASQNVMKKCGMDEPEILDFEGGRFFIAGKWRTHHRLFVFGKEIDVGGN